MRDDVVKQIKDKVATLLNSGGITFLKRQKSDVKHVSLITKSEIVKVIIG